MHFPTEDLKIIIQTLNFTSIKRIVLFYSKELLKNFALQMKFGINSLFIDSQLVPDTNGYLTLQIINMSDIAFLPILAA